MMDSFELNKMIGAFLGVVFIVFSVSLVSDAIFSPHAPATQGYAIEVPEEVGTDGPAEATVSVVDLLASADATAGEAAFRRCQSCHTVEEGGANRVGPNLWDIVNRPIAAHPGFSYSSAMRAFSQGGTEVWDYEHLSGFLQAPRAYVPGTIMAFAGIRDIQEEANLIAYMRTLSDDPVPLPEAPAADEEHATDAVPIQPTPEDDGTSAAPEIDAGTPAPPSAVETEAPAEVAPEAVAPATEAPAAPEAPAGDEPADENE